VEDNNTGGYSINGDVPTVEPRSAHALKIHPLLGKPETRRRSISRW